MRALGLRGAECRDIGRETMRSDSHSFVLLGYGRWVAVDYSAVSSGLGGGWQRRCRR